jgi:hypothetical protein
MIPTKSAHVTERTWEISDIDGSNKRTVTLAQYRAEVDAAKKRAEAIHAANCATIAKATRK